MHAGCQLRKPLKIRRPHCDRRSALRICWRSGSLGEVRFATVDVSLVSVDKENRVKLRSRVNYLAAHSGAHNHRQNHFVCDETLIAIKSLADPSPKLGKRE